MSVMREQFKQLESIEPKNPNPYNVK